MATPTKTLIVPILVDQLVQTTGQDDQDPTTLALDVPELARLGPRIEKLRVHWEVLHAPADLHLQLKGRWSIRGLGKWVDPPFDFSDVYNASTNAEQKIDDWKSDDGDWGLHLMAELWAWNATTGSPLTARVWCYLEVVLRS